MTGDIIHEFSKWLADHQFEARKAGTEIDLLILPQEAEGDMVANLMAMDIRAEVCHMIERADGTVRIWLMGVPIKFTTKLPGHVAWFRYKGGKAA